MRLLPSELQTKYTSLSLGQKFSKFKPEGNAVNKCSLTHKELGLHRAGQKFFAALKLRIYDGSCWHLAV
jgi:hypothetical protein